MGLCACPPDGLADLRQLSRITGVRQEILTVVLDQHGVDNTLGAGQVQDLQFKGLDFRGYFHFCL